jgi:GTPase
MKTTIFGLSSDAADFAMLCVDAPSSVGMCLFDFLRTKNKIPIFHLVDTTREHFSYAITLDVPVFVVINKIDLFSRTNIQQTINCLTYLLKHGNNSIKLEPYVLEKEEDLVKAAELFVEKSICPIFSVSCVTGENIKLLKKFLNILPPRLSSKEQERLSQLPVEYRVGLIFIYIFSRFQLNRLTQSIQTIHRIRRLLVGYYIGMFERIYLYHKILIDLFSGIIREGESFLVGPLLDGTFLPAKVTSIHRYRVPRRMVRAGQAATLCLPQIESNRLRKVDHR